LCSFHVNFDYSSEQMRNISRSNTNSGKHLSNGCDSNTVYIRSANHPVYLYDETETGFRIESETD